MDLIDPSWLNVVSKIDGGCNPKSGKIRENCVYVFKFLLRKRYEWMVVLQMAQ